MFKESKIKGLDTEQFETRQIFFKSKDKKTDVPMFVVHKKVSSSRFTVLTDHFFERGSFSMAIIRRFCTLTADSTIT